MNKFNLLALPIIALALTACSAGNFKQIPYGCDSDESDPYCASVETIYKNAVEDNGRNINVLVDDNEIRNSGTLNNIQSQNDTRVNGASGKNGINNNGELDPRLTTSQFNTVGANALEQRPVYNPERVHRVYRGPWRDDYNILHSGEHLFYKTPGSWNFGSLNTPGTASGLIAPVYPEDLGFSQSTPDAGTTEVQVGRHKITQSKPNAKKIN